MAQHPLVFNKLYINMVKAGELGVTVGHTDLLVLPG